MIRGYLIGPEDGLPGPVAGVKASRRATGGSLTLIESTIDGGPPRHAHLYEDESSYLLDGSLAIECGGDRFTATSGSFVFLPGTLPHTFHSVDGPARLLIIGTPGGLDEYFAALRVAAPKEHERLRETYGIVPG